MEYPESQFIKHVPCANCGSSDANSLYDDGHQFCFACQTNVQGSDAPQPQPKKQLGLLQGEYKDLAKRMIRKDTCKHMGYRVGTFQGATCQIADFYEDGQVVAQKVRLADKKFMVVGDKSKLSLFGMQTCRDGGKKIIITEGEIDALTISQLQNNKWPVVSVPNGAQGAKKAIAKQAEFLAKFEKVVFAFDMDDAGQAAAKECAALLKPGQASIAHLPGKDPNECLTVGHSAQLVDSLWNAKAYRPDGILTFGDLKDRILETPEVGLPWMFPALNEHTYGRRLGEIIALGAGTGVGKTDFMTQQAMFDVTELNEPVAMYFLEQSPLETAKRMAGKYAGKRFHVPDASWSQSELMSTVEELDSKSKIYFYDSWGSTEWSVVKARMTFNAQVHGVKIHYLDHLTALAAAEENEREALEKIMADMAATAKRLNICIIFVSHLATPDGKPHEEGGRVMSRHFKGSRAIGFWSFLMLGLERDQQNDDPLIAQTTTLRVLKDRFTGQATGKKYYLGYQTHTGLLHITDEPKPTETKSPFLDKSGGDF